MVLAGEDFEVRDAKTGEDLTRSILLQIILEEETGGVPMFSTRRWPRSSASTATPCRA
jgi:polyhydroxyalkanoate synthesis regulator protein